MRPAPLRERGMIPTRSGARSNYTYRPDSGNYQTTFNQLADPPTGQLTGHLAACSGKNTRTNAAVVVESNITGSARIGTGNHFPSTVFTRTTPSPRC